MSEAAAPTPETSTPADVKDFTGENDEKPKLSKRKRKYEERRARMMEIKAKKKAEKKRRREEKEKEMVPDTRTPEEIAKARAFRQERNARIRAQFLKAQEELPKVAIDLDFESFMNEQEKTSMAQQVLFSYGMFRKAERPMPLRLQHMNGDILNRLGPHGLSSWEQQGVTIDPLPVEKCTNIPSDQFVYLSADSATELVSLDKKTTYVIGGLVDRNRHKGVTFDKANKLGLRTARLPLGTYLERFPASPVLTVNHVYEILLEHAAHGDWFRACEAAIPSRKRATATIGNVSEEGLSKMDRKMRRKRMLQALMAKEEKEKLALREAAKVAIVSGSSSGIGFAFAAHLAVKHGWNVVMVSRNPQALDAAANRIRTGAWMAEDRERDVDEILNQVLGEDHSFGSAEHVGKCTSTRRIPVQVVTVPCDSGSVSDAVRLRGLVGARFGHVDLMVLSAGDFRWDDNPMFADKQEAAKDLVREEEMLPDIELAQGRLQERAGAVDSSPTKKEALKYLVRANLTTKRVLVENMHQLLHEKPRFTSCSVLTVGSQAGKPNFVTEIEAKEGPGAVDNELGYIAAMRGVRAWAKDGVVVKSDRKAKGTKNSDKKETGSQPAGSTGAVNRNESQHGENVVTFTFPTHVLEPSLIRTELAKREFSKFVTDWSSIPSPHELVKEELSKVLL